MNEITAKQAWLDVAKNVYYKRWLVKSIRLTGPANDYAYCVTYFVGRYKGEFLTATKSVVVSEDFKLIKR